MTLYKEEKWSRAKIVMNKFVDQITGWLAQIHSSLNGIINRFMSFALYYDYDTMLIKIKFVIINGTRMKIHSIN